MVVLVLHHLLQAHQLLTLEVAVVDVITTEVCQVVLVVLAVVVTVEKLVVVVLELQILAQVEVVVDFLVGNKQAATAVQELL